MVNKQLTKEQQHYQELEERFNELSDWFSDLLQTHKSNEEELNYLSQFLSYKQLEHEYQYFKENAYEDPNDEMPFPRLIL